MIDIMTKILRVHPWIRLLLKPGVVILCVAIAASLRVWPLHVLGNKVAYLTFFPAVMISALYGGFSAGLLAAVLSGLIVLLWQPSGIPFIRDASDWLSMGIFQLNSLLISGMSAMMHRSRSRALTAEKEVAEERSRRTDAELKASEGSLKEAQRLARIGSWTWEPASDNTVWSEEMFHIYGLDPAGPPANFEQIPAFYTSESWTALSEAVTATYTTGVPYELDTELVRPDGSHLWATCRGEAVTDASGRIASLRGTVQDVSERKDAERIRHEAGVLRHADEMKTKFLANMSHELRTPLNAIIGFSEMLKDGLLGELSERQRKYVGNIYSSGEHLLALINDILDLSKVEAGKMDLDLEAFDAHPMFVNSLSLIKEKATKHHIRLQVDVPADLGSLRCDPRKVKQIVYNLLSNAAKFTNEGGCIELRASRVLRADVARAVGTMPFRTFPLPPSDFADFLEIRVADSGIGIAAAGLVQLFQPFSQIDSGPARRYAGTGLGLALVKQMAELHGGTVMIESREHEGSCFTVWLPWRSVDDVPALVPENVATETEVAAKALALVVEDDDQAAELIRLQLAMDGIRTVRARTAEDALVLLQGAVPDLITLDLRLPGMDGWEFLGRIKQIPTLSLIPVVIVSIVAEENKGLSLGAAAVLQKPIGVNDLRAALSSIGMDMAGGNHSFKVLVVDDDPDAVELISTQLRTLRYSVHEAYGGKEGIELAHRLHPDLILLDLMMPDVSGVEVVESLKSMHETRDIPIVIVTAKGLTADDRKSLSGDVVKIVAKSQFNHGHFISEVRQALPLQKGRE